MDFYLESTLKMEIKNIDSNINANNVLNNDPLTIIKNFLHYLYISKNIVIVFEAFPSLSLEYKNKNFIINLTYLNTKPLVYKHSNEMFDCLYKHLKKSNKKISRIEINHEKYTALLYGKPYEYEKKYITHTNIIYWGNKYYDYGIPSHYW